MSTAHPSHIFPDLGGYCTRCQCYVLGLEAAYRCIPTTPEPKPPPPDDDDRWGAY